MMIVQGLLLFYGLACSRVIDMTVLGLASYSPSSSFMQKSKFPSQYFDLEESLKTFSLLCSDENSDLVLAIFI